MFGFFDLDTRKKMMCEVILPALNLTAIAIATYKIYENSTNPGFALAQGSMIAIELLTLSILAKKNPKSDVALLKFAEHLNLGVSVIDFLVAIRSGTLDHAYVPLFNFFIHFNNGVALDTLALKDDVAPMMQSVSRGMAPR